MASNEEPYIVSMADCIIVEEGSELSNDVIVAHDIMDDGHGVYFNEGENQNEPLHIETAQLFLPTEVRNSALFTAIHEKNWEEANRLMKFVGIENLFNFSEKWNGWTALHKSCFHRSIPIGLFQDLVSFTVDMKGDSLVSDKWGDTALHLACQHATENMILILLENFPNAASAKNKHGGLPLHTAIHYECTYNVIYQLLKVNPNGIHVMNNHGNSPLELFLHSKNYINPPAIRLPDSLPLYGGDKDQICNILRLLLRSVRNKSIENILPDGDKFLNLHTCLEVNAPVDFIALLISKYPDEVCKEDENGDMPIHAALTLKDKAYSSNVIKVLISANPNSVRVPNRAGRLPISLLAEQNPKNDLLLTLFNTCPFVSGIRDMKSHLYPFASVACSTQQESFTKAMKDEMITPEKNCSNEVLLEKMNRSFMLLMENPAVLRGC